MIKLFDKIRKQMLNENKIGRYFKYAIGETILVTIGILLALQVNTWNNNRELKREELKVMKSLHKEFSENLIRFDDIYRKQLFRKECIESIMAIKAEEVSLDSLNVLGLGIGQQWTYDPFQGIYNSVINSGKIELISNDSLKKRIARFQDLLGDYKEEEIGTMEFTASNYYTFIMDNLRMNFNVNYGFSKRDEEDKNKFKKEFIKVIESDKYENLLVYIYGYMRDVFTEGPILREEIVLIINLLEEEIKKNDN